MLVHGHCHHKAVLKFDREKALLEKFVDDRRARGRLLRHGRRVRLREQHYDVSQACGERKLLPAVRDADKQTVIVTDGFSCREQVQQATDRKPMHFAELCKMALDEHGAPTSDAYPERRYVTPTQPMSGVLLYILALVIVALAIGVIVVAR